MNIAERVERACVKAGLTQAKLAVRIGLSPSALSGALNGRHGLAPEYIGSIARVTGCTEVAMAYCNSCPANVFGPRFLDGVSHSPLASLVKSEEELAEALEAVKRMSRRILNKEGAADMNRADHEAVEEDMLQILDLLPLLGTLIPLGIDTYGLHPDELVARNAEKYRRKGYFGRRSNGEDAA